MKTSFRLSSLWKRFTTAALVMMVLLSGCLPLPTPYPPQPTGLAPSATPEGLPTPLPTRPSFQPGELVDYTVQTGDNLPALAVHFNTTIAEIRKANPIIPADVTTLPPGMPMKIPIYYRALWGSPYQIIPDSLFINGPAQRGFDTALFVDQQPGWFKNYITAAGGVERRGGDLIDYLATNYSVSPRLLLAVLEYQTQALSQPNQPDPIPNYILGYHDVAHTTPYGQLIWAANTLNNGYYAWRDGSLNELFFTDGLIEYPDPWQNAATFALQYYYSQLFGQKEFLRATQGIGLAATYRKLFGDPWNGAEPHLPGSLQQPPLSLPFQPGKSWAFTGGPHTGWGTGAPYSALDFAPPAVVGGCVPTEEWATAVADGIITRSGQGIAVLDLDGDGDEHTGWVIFYLHLATNGLIAPGTNVKTGQFMGHPSCEGGRSTGTHVHISRKYNGEWMLADGAVPFNLDGWVAHNGQAAYEGSLTRYTTIIRACTCSDRASQLQAGDLNP